MGVNPRKVNWLERHGTDRFEVERWLALLKAQDELLAEVRTMNAQLAQIVVLLGRGA